MLVRLRGLGLNFAHVCCLRIDNFQMLLTGHVATVDVLLECRYKSEQCEDQQTHK